MKLKKHPETVFLEQMSRMVANVSNDYSCYLLSLVSLRSTYARIQRGATHFVQFVVSLRKKGV